MTLCVSLFTLCSLVQTAQVVFITQPVWEFLSPDFILTPSIFNSASFLSYTILMTVTVSPLCKANTPSSFQCACSTKERRNCCRSCCVNVCV